MQYTPLSSRDRRLRRGLVLLMCAIAWLAPIVTSDDWLTWAIMWGVIAGLATACWGLLGVAPARSIIERRRKGSASESEPNAT
jgi:hypothetical protein